MSDKLNHSDLSALLAKEAEISMAKADAFTKAIFDLIIEGLEKDGIVKINGLGTFKVSEVADRYSVNVNTGEKIEIKGHKKLVFVPADVLKENVNKPFAMFAPVEVDDTYQDDAEVSEPDEDNNEDVVSEVKPDEESSVVVEDDVQEPSEELAVVEDDVQEPTDEPVVVEDDVQEPTDEPAVEEETPEVSGKESSVAVEEKVDESASDVEVHVEVHAVRRKNRVEDNPRRSKSISKGVYTIVLMLIIGSVYYWFVGKNEEEQNMRNNKEVLLDEKTDKKEGIVVGDMLFVESSKSGERSNNSERGEGLIDTLANDKVPETIVVNDLKDDVKTEEQTAVVEEYRFVLVDELASRSDKDITDADTTLYIAVGEIAVHVVAEDERLAKISNEYYGSRKLWPYIAKYNNMADPGEIAVGMKLSIPKLLPK